MRTTLLILLLSVSTFAHSQSAPVAAACGPKNVTFRVSEGSAPLAPALPESGKALVYFIQDEGQLSEARYYTLKVGLNGAWGGAYRDNAVFTVSVGPGEHHVCANVQSNFESGKNLAFAHFTAEVGKVYYFRIRISEYGGHMEIDQPDSDQAKYLISIYPASVSKPKK
jgi:hypothetical protein